MKTDFYVYLPYMTLQNNTNADKIHFHCFTFILYAIIREMFKNKLIQCIQVVTKFESALFTNKSRIIKI